MRYIISDKTIQTNLIRTANEGLLSILDNNLMHVLAYKYFGVYEDGELIGYQCPYSGKIYSNSQDIIFEHIVPVKSGGGTVLFNCIPASIETNSVSEKGARHLIEWWVNSKYWDVNAPKRLEKLVNYILDGYENVFNTYSIDELEETYLDYIEEDIYSYDEDFELRKYDLVSEIQARHNHINSYQGFLNDCIEQLRKSKIDVSYIENRLNTIQNQKHIFEDIERFKLFQNIIKKLIIEYIGDDNRSYLTYSLNINIKKLMDSIKYESLEQIYFELKQRLNNIVFICNQNGVSFNDYLKNLRDIEEINILYLNQNEIDERIKTMFINNIKIGIDTRIDVFINMLSQEKYTGYYIDKRGRVVPNDNNIFAQRNQLPFKGYESIEGLNTSCFWNSNSLKIEQRLLELKQQAQTIEEKIKYEKVERAIDNYKFYSQIERRIDVFLEMLSKDEYIGYNSGFPNERNIFAQRNQLPFKGYESIEGLNTSCFWNSNSLKIEQRLLELKQQAQTIEEKIKYEKVERAIENFKFYSQIERRIDVFLEMLSKDEYIGYNNGVPNERNIFKVSNQIPFKGYESIEALNTSCFWNSNSLKIEQRLLELKQQAQTIEEKIKYEKVERAIDNFKFYSQIERRIDVFLDMLSKDEYTAYNGKRPNERNIFKVSNQIQFKGYEDVTGLDTSSFWNKNSQKIIEKLFYGDYKNNIEYDKARQAVLTYLKVNTIEEYIDKLDKAKAKNKVLIELRNSQLNEIDRLTKENQLLSNELDNEELKRKAV